MHVTEGEWNPTRQLSLNVLHGSTKHIHCLNQKCCKILVHLNCLSYLKTIPFSIFALLRVYSVPITVVTTLAPSVRESTACWEEPHTCPSRQDFQLKASMCKEMLSVRQLMSLFNEFFDSLKMVDIPMVPDLIKSYVFTLDCKGESQFREINLKML